MTKKQALLRSIGKWEAICFDGYQREEGRSTSCFLCSLHSSYHGHFCDRKGACIISLVTGHGECQGSPYYRTSDWKVNRRPGSYADYQMLMFLYMLWHEYYGDEVSQ